ncbi:LysR family transcriptional regulator [Nitrospirillum viridazoti]|uniref:LysR family transcriptional regulator n=1 Tax=Nitrospirillum viridazoti CBAmc TaxID=1441467 RepID=A0A248K0T2_9PROT|nr:LysR family transcriptional regulator [Nitrospirillum amazonense]ASG24341.1 LysR family transcriptional regulator [Nitrospirillum amazonense CBAmc]TWB33290.1 LysR family transcriptional regulator [Nitrospirillum amazonense]
MTRSIIGDLPAFFAVARELNFSKAAKVLGVSQSTLSATIKQLEGRLGARLLERTTRSVSLTVAGRQLFQSVEPLYRRIDDRLNALIPKDNTPSGTVRLAVTSHIIQMILLPKLCRFLQFHPNIRIEMNVICLPINEVAQMFHAYVGPHDPLLDNATTTRVSPDIRFAVVGSPSYFEAKPLPWKPHDLEGHRCINIRPEITGDILNWQFKKDGQEVQVTVEGQLIFNQFEHALEAAISGFGLAYAPERLAASYINSGLVHRVLDDWCAPLTSHYLYFPRGEITPALRLLIDALEYSE